MEQDFAQRLHSSMDPNGITSRSSCDSDEHPFSIAIAWFLDVTKGMGGHTAALAKLGLPEFIRRVLPILPDAQFLIGAVGDAEDGDQAPLQISQWEYDLKLVMQSARHLYIEQGGGDSRSVPSFESYDLALLLAARMANIDCWLKRGQRGYLFLTGDKCPRERVSAKVANRVFGRTILTKDVPLEQLIAEASEKFHIFVLVPSREGAEKCESYWRQYLGDNVIVMESTRDDSQAGIETALVAAALVALTEGGFTRGYETMTDAIEQGLGCNAEQATRIYRAVLPYAANTPDVEPNREVERIDPRDIIERASGIARLGG